MASAVRLMPNQVTIAGQINPASIVLEMDKSPSPFKWPQYNSPAMVKIPPAAYTYNGYIYVLI